MVSESGAGSASRRFHSGGGLQPFRFLAWMKSLAGVAGIEPANVGTKNRCLTTWLHPNSEAQDLHKVCPSWQQPFLDFDVHCLKPTPTHAR